MVFDYVGMSLGVDRLILVLTQTDHKSTLVLITWSDLLTILIVGAVPDNR